MFVVVYLVAAKTHTVIPKEFVYELVEENIYNRGVNTNQNRLIYFSAELLDVLQANAVGGRDVYIADFHLPVTKQFPPPNGLAETCYIARLKKFYGKYIIFCFFFVCFQF